jgi:hypothetical protein
LAKAVRTSTRIGERRPPGSRRLTNSSNKRFELSEVKDGGVHSHSGSVGNLDRDFDARTREPRLQVGRWSHANVYNPGRIDAPGAAEQRPDDKLVSRQSNEKRPHPDDPQTRDEKTERRPFEKTRLPDSHECQRAAE